MPKDDPNDPDLEVEYDPYESLLDGKTKYHWSKCTHGHSSCWLCFSFGKQLSIDQRGKPAFKVKAKRLLRAAFGNCHTRIRGFTYLATFAYNKDFKTNDCR